MYCDFTRFFYNHDALSSILARVTFRFQLRASGKKASCTVQALGRIIFESSFFQLCKKEEIQQQQKNARPVPPLQNLLDRDGWGYRKLKKQEINNYEIMTIRLNKVSYSTEQFLCNPNIQRYISIKNCSLDGSPTANLRVLR